MSKAITQKRWNELFKKNKSKAKRFQEMRRDRNPGQFPRHRVPQAEDLVVQVKRHGEVQAIVLWMQILAVAGGVDEQAELGAGGGQQEVGEGEGRAVEDEIERDLWEEFVVHECPFERDTARGQGLGMTMGHRITWIIYG